MATNEQRILEQFVNEAQEKLTLKDATKAFEYLTIQEVMREYDLSGPELEAGFLDGGGDSGIDAAYAIINESLYTDESIVPPKGTLNIRLVVITSQYVENFKEKPLTSLQTAFEHLLDLAFKGDGDFTKLYSDGVLSYFERVRNMILSTATRKPSISISVIFATRNSPTEPSDRVKVQAGVLQTQLAKQVPGATVDVQLLGASQVLELIRGPQVFTKNLVCENSLSTQAGNGWLAIVKLPNLYEFLLDDTDDLHYAMFDANVRDFQGETLVNDGILSTLDNTAENPEFWWFNNGVTIVCDAAVPRGSTLVLDSPLIVNGLQTSTIIFNYLHENPDSRSDNRAVAVRVVVPPDESTRDKIIRATNSQNNIPAVFLRGTDKIHRDIEDFLKPRGIYYERRKNAYRNQGVPRAKVVTLGELAQAGMASLLLKASAARARPNSLIRNDTDYDSIFSLDYPMEVFEKVVHLLKSVESEIIESLPEFGTRDRNNIKYHVMMVWAAVARMRAKGGVAESLVAQKIDNGLLKNIIGGVAELYAGLGGNDAVAKGPQFQAEALLLAPKFAED